MHMHVYRQPLSVRVHCALGDPQGMGLIMRELQFVSHGEPSEVVELKSVSEPGLGHEGVLVSMEAAPLNPSDFLYIRGMYGILPAFPSPAGSEGGGRVTPIGAKLAVAL